MEVQPWCPFVIGGETLLVKSMFGEDGFTMYLTDSLSLWSQSLSGKDIEHACRASNPSLEMSNARTLAILQRHLVEQQAPAEYRIELAPDGGAAVLHFEARLDMFAFKWHFQCDREPPELLRRHLTQPLIFMTGELQRQIGELKDLLVQKDREIEEYKATGYPGRYETTPFDSLDFDSRMHRSMDIDLTATSEIFAPPLTALYSKIMKRAHNIEEPASVSLDDRDMVDYGSLDPSGHAVTQASVYDEPTLAPDAFGAAADSEDFGAAASGSGSHEHSGMEAEPLYAPMVCETPQGRAPSASVDSVEQRREELKRKLEAEREHKAKKAKKNKKRGLL
eukprot:m.312196 g.312196  ORF g.312196 m.312196 type:complete len:336 (-) comp29401_c0_seq1:64-1071(-)